MAVVYRHIKPDGEVFYIGIGKNLKRAYSINGRNTFWKRLVTKYGYEVQILKSTLSWEEACELEKILISWYGRRDLKSGTLVNMTDGGEGQNNPSKETRYKMSLSKKGKGGEPHHLTGIKKSKSHIDKMRLAKIGTRVKEEYNKNRSIRMRGNTYNSKRVICINTLKVWNSINLCEEEIGIRNLRDYLNIDRKDLKNKTSIQYLEDYEKGLITCNINIKPKKREVLDVVSGTKYNTIKEAAKAMSIGECTLYKAFKNKDEYNRKGVRLKII